MPYFVQSLLQYYKAKNDYLDRCSDISVKRNFNLKFCCPATEPRAHSWVNSNNRLCYLKNLEWGKVLHVQRCPLPVQICCCHAYMLSLLVQICCCHACSDLPSTDMLWSCMCRVAPCRYVVAMHVQRCPVQICSCHACTQRCSVQLYVGAMYVCSVAPCRYAVAKNYINTYSSLFM